ncbi:OsmC family protein [Ruegeria arenilitoris]|uniref:OsmC family protein n=1 Tax=Ruegeria arenilitoris TaxID=1173585 RepID=UPI001480FD97|nr:OsmC family protein [Ruegeria arenilitoris]
MTPNDTHIQTCQNQVIKHLTENPAQSLSTTTITGSIHDGLQCQVTQGRHSVSMDMGKAMGGNASAPSPGFFAKAGMVGCIAIATRMTAAREGLSIRSVHVEVETETDTLAIFGLGGGNAAPLDTRVRIIIESDEPDAQIDALVNRVLSRDTWFLALRDAQPVTIGWERQAEAA